MKVVSNTRNCSQVPSIYEMASKKADHKKNGKTIMDLLVTGGSWVTAFTAGRSVCDPPYAGRENLLS